jgi:hypothetical protein
MKSLTFLLPILGGCLLLTGCVEDKPAPRLNSLDRNERLAAIRNSQDHYGSRPAPVRPVAAVSNEATGANDTKRLPIDGSWTLKGIVGGQCIELAAIIMNGELRAPGADAHWKNIRPVLGSPARYSAVRVSQGILWGIREDPVEFYLDADGILHHDDSQLAPLIRSIGIITLRRP